MRTIGTTSVDGEVRAVASGALPNGKPVVVNADGTVSVVVETSGSASVGSSAVLDVACEGNNNAVYDVANNKTVFFYRGASNAGKCVVGTVASNNTVSFGSVVTFEDGSVDSSVSAVYHAAAGKIVVVFRDAGNSGYSKARVGTVSGTSISFGTVVTFYNGGSSQKQSAVYSSGSEKIVVAYTNNSTADGFSKVGTVSGTDISFGNQATFESGEVGGNEIGMSYDSNADRVVFSYRDQNNSGYGTAIVGAISGTNISFGSKAVFKSATTYGHSSVYDPVATKVLLSYRGSGIEAIVGTIDPSDNSISFGSSVTVKSDGVETASTLYDANAKFVVAVYGYATNDSKVALKNGTISGTSVSFGSEIMLDNTSGNSTTIANGPKGSAYDSSLGKIVSSYTTNPNGDGPVGKYVVSQNAFTATTLTSENFIGFPKAAASDGGTATVQIGSNISSVNIDLIVTGFDLANAVYDNVSFSINPQEASPSGLFFKPDGTKMFVCGTVGRDVNEYSLSTAWDLSTASYSRNFSVSSQDSYPYGVFFKPEGDIMYISGTGNDKVYQYALSTAWNVSSASYTKAFSVGGQETEPVGLFFKTDGTKMYICGDQGNDVNEYNLSTAWDIATASFSQSFSVASQHSFPQALSFNAEGTLLFVTGSDNDDISQYSLTTGWDVSTASYDDVSFSHSGQEATATGFFFRPDGTKFYLVGTVNDTVFQYSSGSVFNPAMTAGQQYFVQTNGRLGLTADSTSVIAGTAISSSKLIVKG